ncbi:hypothetical protein J3Q64DRAFT_1759368 [Phycomyces blakesleeanus]|uniref:Uncharacterized protein n=2 Tax=Phycomyces blakesleeanus TaxID=4837 RepID=A0A163D0Z0_PHYB8|nr:hypothetical protein PHYBLDRAFT_188905 [Phycomyces blakesleeanus NRRL 1555(-)]OAD67930.1 hypothetical protein PHYBLDRAFT_188905 [Phycomyces blakesleeanus NRRL 1555(-)]|eukprot:XP_018285970.1 hypothetical protein PHYBLDRAFT_188905 [Phycomyces blakesleeanus NRRL 1555(-)]
MLRLTQRRLTSRLYSTSHEHKIYALPFKLDQSKVPEIVHLASYVSEHKFLAFFKILKGMFQKKIPHVEASAKSIEVRMAYMPMWYYDMAVSADVIPLDTSGDKETTLKRMGPERQALGIGIDCYWPGHTWSPMSYLSFGQPGMLKKADLVPFTNEMVGEDVQVLPFTVSPLEDLAPNVSALENLELESKVLKGTWTIKNPKLAFSACYPIYWPVYIAQFQTEHTENKPTTVVIGGHSPHPPIYKWDESKSGPEQWINNGPWLNLEVTEHSWQMNFGGSPMAQLLQKYHDNVVGNFSPTKVDWAEKRIQPYPVYHEQNKKYLKQLFKVWAQQNMLTQLGTMKDDELTIGVGDSKFQFKKAGDFRKDIEKKVGDELEVLEEVEPEWLRDYVIEQRQKKDALKDSE